MKRFLSKILLFLCLFLLSAAVMAGVDVFWVGSQHLGNYQASLLDKVERLQSLDGPKIVLVGNSNLSFGMDSSQLEAAFGMSVVNMGLHGGLGNAFHEEMCRLGVSQGDIVILCHTDYSDDDTIPDSALAWITLEKHSQLWPLIRAKDVLSMLRAYPDYFKDSLVSKLTGEPDNQASDATCYSRSAFNLYGDIVRRPDDRYQFTPGSVEVPRVNDTCTQRINALDAYLRERGAVLLIAAYPIASGAYTPDVSEYDAFEAELRRKVSCPVISHYRDYLIPYEFFYNSCFHLSEEGADIRTKLLIQDIQNWMSS